MTDLQKKIYNERLKYVVNVYSVIGLGMITAGFLEPLSVQGVPVRAITSLFGVIVLISGPIMYRGLKDV